MQLQKLASCQGLGAMPGRQATRAPALASQPLARPSTAAFRHQGVHQSARSHVGARDRKVVLVQALTASTASVITENCTEETVKQAVQAHVAGGSKTCAWGVEGYKGCMCSPTSAVHGVLLYAQNALHSCCCCCLPFTFTCAPHVSCFRTGHLILMFTAQWVSAWMQGCLACHGVSACQNRIQCQGSIRACTRTNDQLTVVAVTLACSVGPAPWCTRSWRSLLP